MPLRPCLCCFHIAVWSGSDPVLGSNNLQGSGFTVTAEKRGAECEVPPTLESVVSKQESVKTDRAAAAAAADDVVRPQGGQPADFYTKLERLMKALVSGGTCQAQKPEHVPGLSDCIPVGHNSVFKPGPEAAC